MRGFGVGRVGVVVAVFAFLGGPDGVEAHAFHGSEASATWEVPQAESDAWPPSPLQLFPSSGNGRFVDRALLASAGAFAGLVVVGYGVWLLRDGPSKCDLCWEATAASAVGGILGGALATTLADGEMPRALVGSVVGAAAGSLVLAVLDRSVDLGPGGMTVAFAIPYSAITAYLARP